MKQPGASHDEAAFFLGMLLLALGLLGVVWLLVR